MTVSHWFVSAVSGLLLRKGDLWLGTQTQPWDCCSGYRGLTIQTSNVTVNAKDGFSQRLLCYSLIHPPAGRAGDLRLCITMRMKHLCCWPEKRESCWYSWGVCGNSVCSAELKSPSEAAAGTCPLGRQGLRTCQQGGSWRCFLGKLTWTHCCPGKWGWQRRRKALFFLN